MVSSMARVMNFILPPRLGLPEFSELPPFSQITNFDAAIENIYR